MAATHYFSGPHNGGYPPIFRRFQMGVRIIKCGCTNKNFGCTNSVRLYLYISYLYIISSTSGLISFPCLNFPLSEISLSLKFRPPHLQRTIDFQRERKESIPHNLPNFVIEKVKLLRFALSSIVLTFVVVPQAALTMLELGLSSCSSCLGLSRPPSQMGVWHREQTRALDCLFPLCQSLGTNLTSR
jgi:hypothetical protein